MMIPAEGLQDWKVTTVGDDIAGFTKALTESSMPSIPKQDILELPDTTTNQSKCNGEY
jgi:hypothetical protein